MVSDAFVPVDRRIWGIDRRTVLPSVVVIAFAGVFALGLPRINEAISSTHQVRPGTSVDLAEGQLTFTPAPGWNLTAGVIKGSGPSVVDVGSTTEVTSQDMLFAVVTGKFSGTSSQLLNQINSTNSRLAKINPQLRKRSNLGPPTKRANIQTGAGVLGVADFYTGLQQQGFNAAFIYRVDGESVGVEVLVRGSDDSLTKNVATITSMLRSIQQTGQTP